MQTNENDCRGSYYVSGYTRDNGTKVEGYVRTCWKHGNNENITVEQVDCNREKIDKNVKDLSLKNKQINCSKMIFQNKM